MLHFHLELKAAIPVVPMLSWQSGWCIATITQHLYCKYLASYQSVRIWEQFLQLESQLELCQNLRQVAATAAVKGSHFSFKSPLLFVWAVQNGSESVTLWKRLQICPEWQGEQRPQKDNIENYFAILTRYFAIHFRTSCEPLWKTFNHIVNSRSWQP